MVDILAGIRVLDFGVWRPAPYATALLADLGAAVLKVEPPRGDPMREFPDLFEMLNAGKRSVVIDLKQPDGRAHALRLATEADVVVEGFRPGVAARLGVGYDHVRAVNASVVYCSVSGYGQTGQLADAPGHDLNYQALAGALVPRDGSDPVEPGPAYGDIAGGMFAALSICAALVKRGTTGAGAYVDVAMADAMASWTGPFPRTRVAGVAKSIRGGIPSYGIFETEGGQRITIAVVAEDHFWRGLCDALGLAAVRDLTLSERIDRGAELRAAIAAAVARYRRDDLVERLLDANVPAAPLLTPDEMLEHPSLVERGTVTTTPWGTRMIASPIRFAGKDPKAPSRAPALGEHDGF